MRYISVSFLFVFLSIAALPNSASGQATFTTCIGDIGNCSPSASSINLGPATVGGGAFVPMKITNTGSATLTINYNFTSSAFGFGLSQTLPPNPLTIAPGASVQTFVVFSPTSAGPQSGQFVSNDNAPGSPHIIPLSGAGVSIAANDFAVMLDPAGPSTITLRQGTNTTFPVFVLEGTGQSPSAGGAAQCAGGPSGSSCSLQPSTFAGFVSQVRIEVSVSVPARSASLRGPSMGWAAMVLMPVLVPLRRRKWPGRFAATFAILLLFAFVVSCGGGSGSKASPPMTITAGVNGTSHTLMVPVMVQ